MDDHREDGWDEDSTVNSSFTARALCGAERQVAYLVVLAGSRVGEMIKLTDGLTVGRGASADFRVEDDGVSREHLRFSVSDDGAVVLSDLETRNGTVVNGQLVRSAVLHDGDKVLVGAATILRFSYADQLDESFHQQMYDSALRDPLTRLYNRRYVITQLEAEFSYSERHKTPLCVIMVDIDYFKKVNDDYGHIVGDGVLVACAQRLESALRREDLLCRYGGEEFLVLCRGISGDQGMAVAERLRRAVGELRFAPEAPELRVTISLGVAATQSGPMASAAELIAAADSALYRAKKSGRNRVCNRNAL